MIARFSGVRRSAAVVSMAGRVLVCADRRRTPGLCAGGVVSSSSTETEVCAAARRLTPKRPRWNRQLTQLTRGGHYTSAQPQNGRQWPTVRERIDECQGMTTFSTASMIMNRIIAMTEMVTRTAKTRAVSIWPLAEVRR